MVALRQHMLAVATVLFVSVHAGAFAQGAVVGIVEGKATLVRQAAKLALAEGVVLQNEDIVETAPASFVQIEFADGGRIGVSDSSRLILAPRGLGRGPVNPRLYLMQGWLKLTQPADKPMPGDSVTPQFELAAASGATILMSSPKGLALFVESGSVKLVERSEARPPLQLAANGFVNVRPGDKPNLAGRPTLDFLAQMPRPFRDPLPSRAAKFRDKPVAPRPLGVVAYEDVSAWLSAEPVLRRPMVERWRPRLRDKAFRAAMIANLAKHPEWDPLLFPERVAKRRAEEKRAREQRAAAQAASAPRATE